MTDSWNVLLDAVPSVLAELIVAILVVVAAKLVSANEISPNATSAREKFMAKAFVIFIGLTDCLFYNNCHFADYRHYCKHIPEK